MARFNRMGRGIPLEHKAILEVGATGHINIRVTVPGLCAFLGVVSTWRGAFVWCENLRRCAAVLGEC